MINTIDTAIMNLGVNFGLLLSASKNLITPIAELGPDVDFLDFVNFTILSLSLFFHFFVFRFFLFFVSFPFFSLFLLFIYLFLNI